MNAQATGMYVDYGSTITEGPPVECREVAQYIFMPSVAITAPIQALCDLAFRNVSGGFVTCYPLKLKEPDFTLIVQFNTIGWIGGKQGVGTLETEALIHIPVTYLVDGKEKGSAFFTPFIWVNNSLALVGGREVYGYPKAFGKTNIELDSNGHIAGAITNTLSAYNSIKMDPTNILTLTRRGNLDPSANVFAQLLNQYNSMVRADMPPFVKLMGDWLTKEIRTQLFLKQFRCADGSRMACYQEISTAMYSCTDEPKPQPMLMSYTYDLEVARSNSAPISTELGLDHQVVLGGGTLLATKDLKVSEAKSLWRMPVTAIP